MPVHLVGAHDTASAVAASPLGPADRGFCLAGTWMLVGVERPAADTSETARAANFSNEPGAAGGDRFLKNVPGFWMLERCAAEWGDTTARELLDAAGTGDPAGSVFDVRDDRFLAPERMEDEVRAAAGLGADAPRTAVVSSIVRSIAAGVASVVDELRADPPGRGARDRRRRCGFARRQARARRGCGRSVVPGPSRRLPSATRSFRASLGRFSSLSEARAWTAATPAALR